ncbi:hypothetical protein [Mobilicoccus caccae]|uniref:ABC-2 type transport system permease protein n=1 Tax=Mobilicoccus caccae TaxID=1859295 RepID=A0ABQ6IYU5_9MICO|nr:hypothetical protein [Mobilicoccus caccae]GMA37991.1 hypothetical protein GCM10025883_00360 [Mobilicoccus caccae]GMA42374.1 hypothetical protein GCM10025883_44190 [Mobilicoccus caccae]GMA42523.1 hypothetical protein GCM10025883_45680 [Mobilicoccus caccae]
MTTTDVRPSTRSRVSLSGAVRAEFVRAKGSAAARFAAAGLALALLQAAGWLLVPSGPVRDWSALFGWQSLYATGLLAPVVALLAASASSREARAREGGTWARPLTPGVAWTARSLVLAWQSLLLHLALTMPLIGLGLLTGLGDPPVARFVTLWLVLWGTSLLPLILSLVLARRVGMLLTVGFALIWQVAGTITAESSLWWAQPWSWGVRAVLPVLEIHANAVGLDPDSPIRLQNPWWPTLACLVAAGAVPAVTAWACSAGEPRRVGLRAWLVRLRGGGGPRGHLSTTEDAPAADQGSPLVRRDFSPRGPIVRGRPRPVRAQLALLRGTGVFPLVLVTLGVVALVGAIWDAEYVRGVATWLVVPLGSCVLAALAWSAMAPGWRVAVLRMTPGGSRRRCSACVSGCSRWSSRGSLSSPPSAAGSRSPSRSCSSP